MDIDTSALFAPIVINGHTVKNRLCGRADDARHGALSRRPGDRDVMTRYYERFARGGFGTVSTEGHLHRPGVFAGLRPSARHDRRGAGQCLEAGRQRHQGARRVRHRPD